MSRPVWAMATHTMIEEMPTGTIDINGGQTVRLTGTVYTPTRGAGRRQPRRVVGQQPAFSYVKGADVSIIGGDSGGQ